VKKVKRYPLRDIVDVRAYKNGHSGVHIFTIHYRIVVIFGGNNNIEPIKVLETGVESKCKK
jgi:hypothetical protein